MDMKISNAELPIGTFRAHLAQQYIHIKRFKQPCDRSVVRGWLVGHMIINGEMKSDYNLLIKNNDIIRDNINHLKDIQKLVLYFLTSTIS